jgi:hypothetical protein
MTTNQARRRRKKTASKERYPHNETRLHHDTSSKYEIGKRARNTSTTQKI